MNPGRYFMPMRGTNPMMYTNNMAMGNYSNFNVFNLLSRLGNGIKNFNWKGMLSGVNKTLNVVNQTIPLVKQAKPMYDNVRSLVRLTKSFKNETRNETSKRKIYNVPSTLSSKMQTQKNIINKENIDNINKPMFFI